MSRRKLKQFLIHTHTSFEAYINWWPLQWPCAWMRTSNNKERRLRHRHFLRCRWSQSGANVYFWFGQMTIFTRELCDFFLCFFSDLTMRYSEDRECVHITQVRRMIYEKWTSLGPTQPSFMHEFQNKLHKILIFNFNESVGRSDPVGHSLALSHCSKALITDFSNGIFNLMRQ